MYHVTYKMCLVYIRYSKYVLIKYDIFLFINYYQIVYDTLHRYICNS